MATPLTEPIWGSRQSSRRRSRSPGSFHCHQGSPAVPSASGWSRSRERKKEEQNIAGRRANFRSHIRSGTCHFYPQSISPSAQEETGELCLPVLARGKQNGLMDTEPGLRHADSCPVVPEYLQRRWGNFRCFCLLHSRVLIILSLFIQIFSQDVCRYSSL